MKSWKHRDKTIPRASRYCVLSTQYSVLCTSSHLAGCRSLLVVVVASIVPALCGCGRDPYQLVGVKGHVTTCDGKPAAGGTVVFYPVDDPDTTGRKKGNPGRE